MHFSGEQLPHLLHHSEVIRFATRAALEERIDVSGAALHEHDLGAFELTLHDRLDDARIIGGVLTAGGAEHDGVRGVVHEQRLRAPVRVFHPEKHELGIDRAIRNAFQVVEQRARPPVLTQEETVVTQLQGPFPDAEPRREHGLGCLFDRPENLALELCEVRLGLFARRRRAAERQKRRGRMRV